MPTGIDSGVIINGLGIASMTLILNNPLPTDAEEMTLVVFSHATSTPDPYVVTTFTLPPLTASGSALEFGGVFANLPRFQIHVEVQDTASALGTASVTAVFFDEFGFEVGRLFPGDFNTFTFSAPTV